VIGRGITEPVSRFARQQRAPCRCACRSRRRPASSAPSALREPRLRREAPGVGIGNAGVDGPARSRVESAAEGLVGILENT